MGLDLRESKQEVTKVVCLLTKVKNLPGEFRSGVRSLPGLATFCRRD